MRYFLSGGSKSGKSMLGQRLARDMAAGGPLYYIATMIPRDEEDQARIRRHLQESCLRAQLLLYLDIRHMPASVSNVCSALIV